jgi:hypothetical protein
LGAIVFLASGASWILARERWQQVDPLHPGKILTREVFGTIISTLPWKSRVRANVGSIRQAVFGRFRGSNRAN